MPVNCSKKVMLAITALFSLIILGCSGSLPPEPGSPSAPIGQAIGVYDGYGVPYDVFNNNVQVYFLSDNVINLPLEENYFNLGVSVSHEGGFVYKYGYYYTNSGWQKFEFLDKTVGGSNWIKDGAKTYLGINSQDISPGENYIVAYSCKKYDGVWRCGCTSEYGPCNQWMLQTYLFRSVELPPEPVPPGSIITTRVYISPNGELVKSGRDVDIYASLQSTKEFLDGFEEPVSVTISNPDGREDFIALNKLGDVSCNECKGDDCYRQFNCYISFGATYIPNIGGEYFVTYQKNTPIPQNMQIENGNFKVVSGSVFNENLIESDIGSYRIPVQSTGYYSSYGDYFHTYYYNGNNGINVDVHTGESAISGFEYVRNDQSYSMLTLEGNLVYTKRYSTNTLYYTYYEDVANQINFEWWSNGKKISLYVNGHSLDTEDYLEVVKAYLKKHPSTKFPVKSDFLIEEGIGNYKYTRSAADQIGNKLNFRAYYEKANEKPTSYAEADINYYDGALEDFKKINRLGNALVEKANFGDGIIYKIYYPEFDGRKREGYTWISGKNKWVVLFFDGSDIGDSDIVVAAYLKKHPSDNVIIETEHYPDVLIESDIDAYKYIISAKQEEDGLEFYRAAYRGSQNLYYGVVINFANISLRDTFLKEKLPSNSNLTTIDGHKVYTIDNSYEKFNVWTNKNSIIATFIEQKRDIPLEITKAYLNKYPSDLPLLNISTTQSPVVTVSEQKAAEKDTKAESIAPSIFE